MDLTITSVLSAVFWDSLLIMLLCFFFKIGKVSRRITPECMIGILLTAMCRLFIPLEFPYAKDIPIKDALTSFRRGFAYQVWTEPFEVTVRDILCAVWVLGIIVVLLRNTHVCHGLFRLISILPEEDWSAVLDKHGLRQELLSETEGVRLVRCHRFSSPCMTGLWHPCIILPKLDSPEEDYSDEYYRFILLHELMHVRKKDIVWKVMIDFLCIVFWWDYALWYLRKQLFILIEVRNDRRITEGMKADERAAYERCLEEIALQSDEKNIAFVVSFHSEEYKELRRRREALSKEAHYSRFGQVLACLIFGVALFFSSVFVFEPYSWDWDEGVPFAEGDIYLIENGNEYDVYVFGVYTMTTDSLEGFEDVEIYESLQEAEKDGQRIGETDRQEAP